MSLSVEEVQTFFSLIAEERIQRELDGATPKEKALCITLLLNLLYLQSMFSVYIFTSVSVTHRKERHKVSSGNPSSFI